MTPKAEKLRNRKRIFGWLAVVFGIISVWLIGWGYLSPDEDFQDIAAESLAPDTEPSEMTVEVDQPLVESRSVLPPAEDPPRVVAQTEVWDTNDVVVTSSAPRPVERFKETLAPYWTIAACAGCSLAYFRNRKKIGLEIRLAEIGVEKAEMELAKMKQGVDV